MNSNIALKLVENECLDLNLDISKVVEVWHCYILQNEKWLFAVPESQLYWEVTFNSNKKEFYVDRYEKVSKSVFPREKARPTSLNVYTGFEQ